jgi:hypothetical protein
MRRCFIHVGTHKTGTTSIQHMMSSRTAELQAKGYHYPQSGQPQSSLPAHHNIAWQMTGNANFRSEHGTISDLLAEVRDRPEDVILSSEDFSSAIYNKEFREFVTLLRSAGFAVTAILYLRSQLDWLPRLYLTLVQAGWDLSWHKWLNVDIEPASRAYQILIAMGADPTRLPSSCIDYLDVINTARGSGIDDMIVRSYDAANASVCSDFLSIFGLTLQDLNLNGETRTNQSLPLREYLQMFTGQLSTVVPPDERRIQLSPQEQRRLLHQFSETNRQLFTEHGIPEPTVHCDASGYYIDELFSRV